MTTPLPHPELQVFERLDKVERENRNLAARVQKLEKQNASYVSGLIGHAILLLAAGILAGYLGFFPPNVDRLPLQAKTVEAGEFVLRTKGGTVRARLLPTDAGFRLVDEEDKVLFSRP